MTTTSPVEKAGGATATYVDQRIGSNKFLSRNLGKVFPDHWSFMLGEIALYSFIVVMLTGVFLTLWFKPSMAEVIYDGSYVPLKGIHMSQAYESTLEISFDVRGGLLIRQMHHWSALIFIAAMAVHMFRVFFTGAFRKPREFNWLIGVVLTTLGLLAGFSGYSLPDDLLSGTGLQIARGIVQAVPIVGTWAAFLLFDGEFPGTEFISRLYGIHILLIPGLILALVTVHLMLVWTQKHTQFPGPGRTNDERGRLPAAPGLHGQGGRLLLRRLRHHRPGQRPGHDQPDLDLRAVHARSSVRGLPARLVHRLPRRRPTRHAELGDGDLRLDDLVEHLHPRTGRARASCSPRSASIRSSSPGSPATSASTTCSTARATPRPGPPSA